MVNLVGNYKENHKLPIAHISRWLRYPKKHCFSKMRIIPNHPQGLKITKYIWNQYLYILVVSFRVPRMGNVIIPSRCSIQIINQPTKLFLSEKNNSNRDDLNRDNSWRSHLRNCPSRKGSTCWWTFFQLNQGTCFHPTVDGCRNPTQRLKGCIKHVVNNGR